jgi:hypothetical protein
VEALVDLEAAAAEAAVEGQAGDHRLARRLGPERAKARARTYNLQLRLKN